MNGINLKPCPCCGSTAAFNKDDDGANWVQCTKETCGLSSMQAYSLMDSCLPQLADTWNRRTPSNDPAAADTTYLVVDPDDHYHVCFDTKRIEDAERFAGRELMVFAPLPVAHQDTQRLQWIIDHGYQEFARAWLNYQGQHDSGLEELRAAIDAHRTGSPEGESTEGAEVQP